MFCKRPVMETQMLEKHDHSKDKPASVKNLDKAKAHGCVNACPGCAGFFRSLLSKKARGNFSYNFV